MDAFATAAEGELFPPEFIIALKALAHADADADAVGTFLRDSRLSGRKPQGCDQ